MATRSPWPGQVVDGEIASDDDFNSIPGGWLGYAESTTPSGTFTTGTDLTGLSVTVTVPASRRIKVTGFVPLKSTAAGDVVELAIFEGATALQSSLATTAAVNGTETLPAIVVLTPSTGSHTYKLQGNRASGAGNVNMACGATSPAFILVEDLGPSS